MVTVVVLLGLFVIAVLLVEIRSQVLGVRLDLQSANEALDGSNPLFSRAELAEQARKGVARRTAFKQHETELMGSELWKSEQRNRPCKVSSELRARMAEVANENVLVNELDRLLSVMQQLNLDVRNGRETLASARERFEHARTAFFSDQSATSKALAEDWETRAFGADVA